VIATLGSLGLASTFGTSFLPEFNEGTFTVFVMAPPGTSLGESDRMARGLERQLTAIDGVRSVVRRTGRADPGGRSLGVLDAVIGRRTDFVVAPDGRIMHALALIYVLRAVPGVGQFKLIQHATDRLEVRVVPDARWDARAEAAIVEGLRQRLGDVAIELRRVEHIPPEASGKHRYVVSHVRLADALAQAAA